MRLTLRTLLAYMDDILDPADQEELGRKIESSPFATELIHRSRDAVRRVRLSAPEAIAGADDDIHGGDNNLDANTAAEYLDNVLSPEAVADFERSCLEAGPNADMLLAEATSCHHILTLVLGEPAEVDADLRQRMYALAQSPAAAPQVRIEPAHVAATPVQQQPIIAAAGIAPAAATRTTTVDPDEAAVPDYMLAAARERRRTQRMIAAVIGAVLVGGGLMFLAMGGTRWLAELGNKDVQLPEEAAAIGTEDQLKQGPAVGEAEGPSTAASTGEDAAATATVDPASEAPPFNPDTATASSASPPQLNTPTLETPLPATETQPEVTLPPEAPAESVTAEAAAGATDAGTAAVVGTLPAETAEAAATAQETTAPAEATAPMADQGDPPAATTAPTIPPAEAPVTGEAPAETGPPATEVAAAASASPSATVPPDTAATADGEAATAPPAAAEAAMADAGAATAGAEAPATGEATTPAAETAAAQPKPIGAYLGNNDLLLTFNPSEKAWIRLAPRSAFMGGEQLLTLPTFRTHVVLADINAYLSDGAQIELGQPPQNAGDAGGDLAVHIPFGRLVLNSGLSGNRIELSLVDQTRVIELGPSSSLAIEVRRIFVPAPLDRRQPAPTEVYWYLTSGTAKWGDAGSAEAPATWTTIDGADSEPLAIEELPAWVDRESISDLERRARERIAEALVAGEPVSVRLLELSDPADRGRRTEDRALAARCGAYVGLYDPLVTALGDVNQRASWKAQIEGLRQAIARDPSAVEGIHAAFALERGPEAADDLVEMLLGFDRAAVGATREEVQQGAIVRLLRWMKDDDLLYRVLAWYNVNEILNTRDVGGYKPEQTASQRTRMLNRIWERFERGELMPPNAEADE